MRFESRFARVTFFQPISSKIFQTWSVFVSTSPFTAGLSSETKTGKCKIRKYRLFSPGRNHRVMSSSFFASFRSADASQLIRSRNKLAGGAPVAFCRSLDTISLRGVRKIIIHANESLYSFPEERVQRVIMHTPSFQSVMREIFIT